MKKKLKPIIGITMGDAAGIGPEIICKIFLRKSYKNFCDFAVIGDKCLFDKTIQHYKYNMATELISQPEDIYLLKNNVLGIISIDEKLTIKDFQLGMPMKNVGIVAMKSIDKAIELAKSKKIDAIVTAPINKEVVALSSKKFIGHTEYIASKLKVVNFNMMMVSNKVKITIVTTHLSLKEVAKHINKEKVKNAIINTYHTMQDLGYRKPKIAVLSLNPHASDGGLFGNEEQKAIIPAIKELKDKGIYSDGPFVSDAFFVKYNKYPVYDAIIAMYHDQALIPFKMLSFGSGINVTIGLPLIRTSVDHGTAYDIAGKNMAYDRSLFEALKFSVNLAVSLKTNNKNNIDDYENSY